MSTSQPRVALVKFPLSSRAPAFNRRQQQLQPKLLSPTLAPESEEVCSKVVWPPASNATSSGVFMRAPLLSQRHQTAPAAGSNTSIAVQQQKIAQASFIVLLSSSIKATFGNPPSRHQRYLHREQQAGPSTVSSARPSPSSPPTVAVLARVSPPSSPVATELHCYCCMHAWIFHACMQQLENRLLAWIGLAGSSPTHMVRLDPVQTIVSLFLNPKFTGLFTDVRVRNTVFFGLHDIYQYQSWKYS